MFAKLTSTLILASALVAGAVAKPVPASRDLVARTAPSFNHWGGLSSFDGFDNFYGSDNFDGSAHFVQNIEQETRVVCHTQAVEIIQQRLLVIQEMAKRIILEQVCEVETQTVVFEQFHASLGNFHDGLHRISGHQPSYDSGIASHFGNIVHGDGSLSNDNFGFSGRDFGSHSVVVGGSNWDNSKSPASVGSAFTDAQSAISSLH